MNIPQRDIATAEAAKLVLGNLERTLRDTKAPRKLIQLAIIPVFGIRWDAQVIRRLTRNRLCRILCSLRNSKLDPLTYRRVSLLWHSASETNNDFPTAWGPWRVTIERFNLDDETKLQDWIEVIDTFIKLGWDAPQKLALVPATQLRPAMEGHPKALQASQLWTASTLLFADLSAASFHVLKGASVNAENFIEQVRSAAQCSRIARTSVKAALNKAKISRLPVDFDKLGPSAKLKVLRQAQLPQYKVNNFFRTAAQTIALTGIQRCFKSFASGIRCYFSFCELRGTPPFPVRERVVVEWSSIFKPNPTFSNYVGYLRKACHFLEQPLSWDTPAVRNTVAALKLEGAGRFRFPNFIRSEFVAKIVAKETRDGPFAQLSFISFLYALRVPSEALILRRAYLSDDLTGFEPMRDTALIGLRGPPGHECLVIRFLRRKNLPNGCILSRPCFCKLEAKSAKRLCPIHAFWPAIASRVKCGEELFSGFTPQNVNTTIKAVLHKLGVPHADCYTSHGYRRGAAQELKERGCQWPIVASLGEWRSLAFMGYLDIARDVARDMSKLLVECEQLSDEEVRHWVTGPIAGVGLPMGVRTPLLSTASKNRPGIKLILP